MTESVTRRGLIAGAAAAAAAGAAPAAARTPRRPKRRRADVVVVGAGFAGLTAAREIARAGRSVIVLEARDRVGGRVVNHALGNGKVTEMGGTFIGPTQDHLAALAKELGIGTFKTFDKGENVSLFNGRTARFAANDPVAFGIANPAAAPDVLTLSSQLNDMARTVPVAAPWKAPRAGEWDGQTFETWKLANTLTPAGRAAIDAISESVWGAMPRDLSFLYVLLYVAAAGNESTPGTLERLVATTGGAQESRFVGGTQLICIEAARQLGRKAVVLRSPVRRIVQRRGGTIVETDRASFAARRVIVAMPPALAGLIDYRPALPALRAQLTQRTPMGSYAKVEAIYDKPFWRGAGLTGQAFGDRYVSSTFDQTPPDGTPGVLVGFVGGTHARRWEALDGDARRKLVLDDFAAYFGPQAAAPTEYLEARWTSDIWTRGDPVGFTPPGVLVDFGEALRAPVGRIHWAGTETSDYWIGYMDGAVRSGERAAKEALAVL
jgi:monoamine oxidase